MEDYNAITPDQIRDWKAKYGANSLREVSIKVLEEESEEVSRFVLRKPGRSVMEAVAVAGAKNDIAGSNKILIANCVLGGDMAALENDAAVFLAVLDEIRQLVSKTDTTVKKL